MGKIEFSNCQDVRNQKRIQELDCPRCHEPGGIEAFVKDGILAEDGVCDLSLIHIFPASGKIFLQDHADHYLSVEDAVTVGEILLQKLSEAFSSL